ncbi:MAG: glycosyltransferase [Planctomycetota bacterium]
MKIVIFEPHHGGHRSVYVAHLVRGLRELPVKTVLVTSRGAKETDGFQTNLEPLRDSFEVDDSFEELAGDPMDMAKQAARGLPAAIGRHQADHAYLPYGDGVGQVLGIRRGWPGGKRLNSPTETVLHHSQQAYPKRGLKRKATVAAHRWAWARSPFARIHHVDRLEYEWWQEHGLASARASFLPDPVDAPPAQSPSDAAASLGLDPARRYVGTTGMIDARKGCDKLLEAFVAADLDTDVSLLLVGRHSPGIKAMLAGRFANDVASGRICSINRFVTMDELHAALFAMQLVVTAHPRHIGISSIVIRAAACGRPVLGSSFGWIEQMVNRFGMGQTCNVSDPMVFAAALRESLALSAEWEMGPSLQRFVEFHRADHFERTLVAMLRERLGLPRDAALRDWDWVQQTQDPPIGAAGG